MPPGATEARPSPYAGRKFALKVTFPDAYPFKAPDIVFRASAMWHPSVDFPSGRICGGLPEWGPTKMVRDWLIGVRELIAHPPADGHNTADAAAQLTSGALGAYEAQAKKAAESEPAV